MTDVNSNVQSVTDEMSAWSEKRYFLQYRVNSIWQKYGMGFTSRDYAVDMLVAARNTEANKSNTAAPIQKVHWRLILEKIETEVLDL